MNSQSPSYRGYRFPPQFISYVVWLYYRFSLSFRDIEDLLAQRGVDVSYETIRQWCEKFGSSYAAKARKKQSRLGDTWHLDELFVKIQGRRYYLWRAVDQDGDVIDILIQPRRDQRAAKRFLRKLVKGQRCEPIRLVTDKLRRYRSAHCAVMPSVLHDTRQYANNRADSEKGRCGVLSLQGKRSGSYRYTGSCRICFDSAVTSCGRSTTGSFALARF